MVLLRKILLSILETKALWNFLNLFVLDEEYKIRFRTLASSLLMRNNGEAF